MGSPFSGQVLAVFKESGTQVAEGEGILSIGAMKMVINVSAPADGYLHSLDATVGENIEKGDLLFEIRSSP